MRIFLFLLFSSGLLAQDAGMVLRTSVGYRTLKGTRSLSDEQKKEVGRLEQLAREAGQSRDYAGAMRHYSHGIALMNGMPWTAALETAASLQASADRAIIVPGAKVTLWLKPIFTPEQKLDDPFTVTLVLRPAKGTDERALGEAKKLESTPFSISAAVPAAISGDWFLEARLSGASATADTRTRTYFNKAVPVVIEDLSAEAAKLRAAIDHVKAKGSTALPTAEYTLALFDRASRGEVRPHGIEFRKEFVAASSIVAAIESGFDPFAGKKGDSRHAYRSPVDQELQPYRVFIPDAYDGRSPAPLVVALHGMGGDENSMFDGYSGVLKREAARVGFIVACPKGRDSASMYMGSAEKDVLDVLAEVRRGYNVDPNRIYLMGHSMGAYGTWSIAMRHPEIWAALGPISGGGLPSGMASIKTIPEYVVHGDNDKTVPVSASRSMVEAGKTAGAEIQYVEVPGGSHTDIAVPNFGPMLDFFAKHSRAAPAQTK